MRNTGLIAEQSVSAERRSCRDSARAEIAALARSRDAELLHLRLQRGPLHRQAGRSAVRAAQHPAGFPQRAEDVFPFGVGQGARRRRLGCTKSVRTSSDLRSLTSDLRLLRRTSSSLRLIVQRRARREDDRALDDVLQLADVARPGILHQRVHGLGRNGLDPPAHAPGDCLREMADEPRNVVAALAQGGSTTGNTFRR